MEEKTNVKSLIQIHLKSLMEWVTGQIKNGLIPRFVDVIDFAHRIPEFKDLTKKLIVKELRLHPYYLMNSTQARQKLKTNRNRAMIVNTLGHLHGDIGFFSVVKDYETPISYRSGYVIFKDPLSHYIIAEKLIKTRDADSIIKAFEKVFEKYTLHYDKKEKVKSVAFDREKSVMSNKVQLFLKTNNILFHAFFNTSSKSKMAENAIKQVRTGVARLRAMGKEKRWWLLLDSVVDSLNSMPIRINNKYLTMQNGEYYTPKTVSVDNVEHYKKQLQKADASFYFSQFEIDPRWERFTFQVGDFVRPKLIVTSSDLLGIKRSEQTLEPEIFVIKKQLAYVSRKNTIERAYVCLGLTSNRKETFQESEIALTPTPFQ